MDQLEQNVIRSFRKVKEDVLELQREVSLLQLQLTEVNKRKAVAKKAPRVVKRKAKKSLFASKAGKAYFASRCMFGKRVSAKNKITFANEATAKRQGFKKCGCEGCQAK